MIESIKTDIDTSDLLTILGVVAAVWAIIPQKSRLNFRLRVSPLDWLVITFVVFLCHYLVFESVFRSIGWYYTLGPWLFGLDKSSGIYLLLLSLSGFILFRAKTTKLAKRNIGIFEKLFNSLLMTKQYAELAPLLEQHVGDIFDISDSGSLRARVAEFIRPRWKFEVLLAGEEEPKQKRLEKNLEELRSWIADQLEVKDRPEKIAREIVRKLTTTPHLICYLAGSYPYLCLEILKQPLARNEEFLDEFMRALIEDETSIFYAELRNNHNIRGHHRLAIPDENKLLSFFFKDIKVAEAHGVYRSVGEVTCQLIDFDSKLATSHNGPLGYYDQVGIYKCPIYCGIQFFQIMVHEGLHQGIQSHLWLYYFTHFTDKIVERLRPLKADDSEHEFSTPFHFLLYRIVSTTMDWIDEAQYIEDKAALRLKGESLNNDNAYIPFNAALAIGRIMHTIISSEKLGDRFKVYMLEVVLRRLGELEGVDDMKSLSRVIEKSLIYRDPIWKTDLCYRKELESLYEVVDHVLRANTEQFGQALKLAFSSPED